MPNGHDSADLAGVPPAPGLPARNGSPLELVFGGHWYGRNGPGVLLDALAQVGTPVAALTVVGSVSPPIQKRFERVAQRAPIQHGPLPRGQLYRRLAQADAAVVTLDDICAVESRLPAKVYDCLAVGVPRATNGLGGG